MTVCGCGAAAETTSVDVLPASSHRPTSSGGCQPRASRTKRGSLSWSRPCKRHNDRCVCPGDRRATRPYPSRTPPPHTHTLQAGVPPSQSYLGATNMSMAQMSAAPLSTSFANPLRGSMDSTAIDFNDSVLPTTPVRRSTAAAFASPQGSPGLDQRARQKYQRTGVWRCPMCSKTQTQKNAVYCEMCSQPNPCVPRVRVLGGGWREARGARPHAHRCLATPTADSCPVTRTSSSVRHATRTTSSLTWCASDAVLT